MDGVGWANLEPRLLAVLRTRLAQLEGMEG
jgi:hypothetical protein